MNSVTESMTQLKRLSHEVSTNISEINLGLGNITKTFLSLEANATEVGTVGDAIFEATQKFQIPQRMP